MMHYWMRHSDGSRVYSRGANLDNLGKTRELSNSCVNCFQWLQGIVATLDFNQNINKYAVWEKIVIYKVVYLSSLYAALP
jgi:hypothetical protein